MAAVAKSSPAQRAGFQVGDEIVEINKRLVMTYNRFFSKKAWDGTSPLMSLGQAMSLPSMAVTVQRDGKQQTLSLDLSKHPKYSSKLDDCKRAADELKKLDEIVSTHLKSGKLMDGISQGQAYRYSMVGLYQLNNHKNVTSFCKKLAAEYAQTDFTKLNSNWYLAYQGNFLCEYYLRTKDKRVLPAIKTLVAQIDAHTGSNGRHGHRASYDAPGGKAHAYGGSGLNAVTAHIYLTLVLAEKCGVRGDPKKKQAIKKWLKVCTGRDGGLGYNSHHYAREGMYRTSIAMIAWYLDGDREMGERHAKFLLANSKNALNGHGFGHISLMWTFLAHAKISAEARDEHFKNWHWYFNVTKTPENYRNPHFYLGGTRSDKGNGPMLTATVHGMIFSTKDSKLAMLEPIKHKVQ